MKRRFCQHAFLKPEKVDEYVRLHAAVWPEVQKTIRECNLSNYSIHIMGNTVVSYFEYAGDDFAADMARMESDPVTLEWWKHTKPCFEGHGDGVYYEDMEEIFYLE